MKPYGVEKLTVTSPVQTFTEPLSLADARAYLEIPAADTTRDSLVEVMITAAREAAEVIQQRDLVRKQWDMTIDAIPCEIETRDHLSTVDLFRYRNSDGAYTTLSENTDYIVDTTRNIIRPPYGESWPSFTAWPTSAVLVRYTVIPPAIPKHIIIGMKMLISAWFNNRLPFELGASAVQEYPFAVTQLFRMGARERI